MTETITERERPEDSPSVPTPDTDLDALLREYDEKTASQAPESTESASGADVSAESDIRSQSVDEQIADLLRSPEDTQRIDELTQQVDGFRTAEHRRAELEAFDKFADDLQTQMPNWVPADYTRAKLQALAHDPQIALAWDLRNVDKSAAHLELAKVQVALNQLQQNPTAADPKRVEELQQYGARLQVAVNSAAILRKARLDILNEAAKLKPPIDEEVTATRMELAQIIREGGSGRGMPPEKPPDLSRMSDAELRRYTLENFGF
jgi:hypothetical protein